MSWKRKYCPCFSYLSNLSDLSHFLQSGTGKPLDAESIFPQSPGLSAQGENSPKGDTEPGSPRAAHPSLDEGKGRESPKETGKNNGKFLPFLKRSYVLQAVCLVAVRSVEELSCRITMSKLSSGTLELDAELLRPRNRA